MTGVNHLILFQTISCLLINPNPDSALNSAAGSLLQDDYEAFARQAKLMTAIHAPIPTDMKAAVQAAKRRGEDASVQVKEEAVERPVAPRASSSTSSVVMKKRPQLFRPQTGSSSGGVPTIDRGETGAHESDDEEEHDPAKENDPSLSPHPISPAPLSPRKHVLGKRPLSSLPTPVDPEYDILDEENQYFACTTPSEKNIAANQTPLPPSTREGPPKKSPKLIELSKGVNASGRIRDDSEAGGEQDNVDEEPASHGQGAEKENFSTAKEVPAPPKRAVVSAVPAVAAATKSTKRNISTASQSSGKSKARVGVRRL